MAPLITCWLIAYRTPDGLRLSACGPVSRDEAVRQGAHGQCLTGWPAIYRVKVTTRAWVPEAKRKRRRTDRMRVA